MAVNTRGGEISPLHFVAVEMTVEEGSANVIVSFRNDYKLPAAMSSRAEGHVVMGVVCRDSIETQSREISSRNASYTIEA